MQENPYAPPNAAVEDVSPRRASQEDPPWFPVSVTKLLIMFVCTLSLYQLYWFYKNWRYVQRREQIEIIPAARAIFGVFFCYSLFTRIRDFDGRSGSAGQLAAGGLAAGWIICNVLWRLPDPYGMVAMGAVIFMLPVQAHANAINAAMSPDHDRNSRFSLWNWCAVVPGGLLLAMAVIGTLLPE